MSPSWRSCTLGDFIELKRGYDLPKHSRRIGGVPVVSSSGVSGEHDEAKVAGPGVVTGRYGTLGEVFYVEEPFWPLNTTLYVRDFMGNDPRFVSYFLRSMDFGGASDKSSVPGLNRNDLHRYQVFVPPLAEQEAIAQTLGALDAKIEHNRRTAEQLEELARATFQAWFVDFAPVHAKAAGATSYPGLPQAAFETLPETFTGSSIGDIPQGWKAGSVGSFGKQHRMPVAEDRLTAETAYFGLEHLPRRSLMLSAWGDASKLTSGKSAFKRGDILFGKLRPYFHKVGPAPVDGVCSTDIVVVRALQPGAFAFLLMLISSDAFVEHTSRGSVGTKMPRTKWKDMAAFPVAKPPEALLRVFETTVRPMLEWVEAMIWESHELSKTRDYLLPKLLSGMVTVNASNPEVTP